MTTWAIRLLGFHGVLVAISAVFGGGSLLLQSLAVVVAFVPWCLWAFGPAQWRARAVFSYGLVPASVLVAAAIAESDLAGSSTALDALRTTVGMLAQLVATNLVDRPLEREVTIELRDRPSLAAEVPTARARRRAALIAFVSFGLLAMVAVAPFVAARATAAERTFATVSATVLGATLVLTVLPLAMRRERAETVAVRTRVMTALVLTAIAAAALVVEATTRSAP